MSFAQNLRQIRKEKGLSQEEFAEIIDVSRQAVSKWEIGEGYPEVDKLLMIAKKLDVSLDFLMSTETSENTYTSSNTNKSITITSLIENVVCTCYKVQSSQKMKGGKRSPQYALFGVGNIGSNYWGEPTVFLGWYADIEALTNEIKQIQEALMCGKQNYQLQYNVKVTKKLFNYVLADDK